LFFGIISIAKNSLTSTEK